jgi:hypothetical protein
MTDVFDDLSAWLDDEWKAWTGVPKSAVRRHVETGLLIAYGLACAMAALAYERLEDFGQLIRPRPRRNPDHG